MRVQPQPDRTSPVETLTLSRHRPDGSTGSAGNLAVGQYTRCEQRNLNRRPMGAH